MISKVKEFMTDTTQALADQARTLGKAPAAAARRAATRSAEQMKALKNPVRVVARSGIKLTAVSQSALQGLIELQEQIVTSALDEAAARLEGAARTDNVLDLVRDQAEVLRATRVRILNDMNRAVEIVTDAGRGMRDIATETYTKVRTPATAAPAAKAKARAKAPRKAKRAARKAPARAKKAK